MNSYDVVVIGGGQAGLASAHHLQEAGLSHIILEAGDQVGGSWPHYYDSLTLFSPARYCALPGLGLEGDPDRYPSRDEIVEYLRRYADHFGFAVRTGARVAAVDWRATDHVVRLDTGEELHARAVIAATGGFGRPSIPAIDGMDRFGGRVLHVAEYRTPEPFAGQRVIVVGAGNSAVQVAAELAGVADVTLATRAPVRFKKQAPLGRDIHWWLDRTGIDRLPLGRKVNKTTPVLDTGRYQHALAAGRPDRQPMFDRLTPAGVNWPNGVEEPVDSIIFATGYVPDLGYLPVDAFGPDGWPLHRGGVSTAMPTLGYVGLPGQRGIASATLRGVGPDAGRVVAELGRRLEPAPTTAIAGPGRARSPITA